MLHPYQKKFLEMLKSGQRVVLLPPTSTEPRGLAWHEEVVVAGQLGATVH